MSVFKDELEKEHVVSELCKLGMYKDLGYFFATTPDLTSEDVFEFAYLVPNSMFYVNMFQHIFALLDDELRKGRFTKFAGNILPNIYLDEFVNARSIQKIFRTDRRVVLSVFLRDLAIHLISNGYSAELSFFISTLSSNPNFDVTVLKDMLKSDMRFSSAFIVEDILSSRILDLWDIMDIIESRFERTTNEDILDMFRQLYTTEETLIELLNILKSRYTTSISKRGVIRIRSMMRGKTKRFYELLRGFLTEVIISEAEVDLWEYLTSAEEDYAKYGDLNLLDLFVRIKRYINSDDRRINMVSRFNELGHEDPDTLLSFDEQVDLNQEVHTIRYIYAMEYLNPFRLFIRLFNINRISYLSYSRSRGEIQDILRERLSDSTTDIISNAVDPATFNILLNY